jgi:hypothetical protein
MAVYRNLWPTVVSSVSDLDSGRSVDPDPGGHTSAGYSLLRVKGFSCSMDILYEGLEISKLKFLIKKIFFFSAVNFWSSNHWFRIQIGTGYLFS